MSPTPRPVRAHQSFTSPTLAPGSTAQAPAARATAPPAERGSEIAIEQVDVRRVERPADADTCRVAAVVRLGRLAPADVRVCVMPVTAGLDDDPTTEDADRLWSIARYDEGVYRFEADLPAARLRRSARMKVHVALVEDPDGAVRMPQRGCWHLLPADRLRCDP